MMVEEYEYKEQQKASFWRTAYSLLSDSDANWKELMPLPLIDVKKDVDKISEEERLALLEKYNNTWQT